jgi:hypothetical protein
MRRQNQARSMAQRILNRRQRLADAGIVHHPPIFERHIEITRMKMRFPLNGRSRIESLDIGWLSFTEESD